jgi:DNA-directed RNA polymerase specialized sigma24 family protein
MFFTANEILQDKYEAEDALQEAFIGIARNMKTVSKIEDPKDLFYYLQSAARNAALNRLPKKQVYTEAVPLHQMWNLSDSSLWSELCEKLDYEALTEVLSALPQTYQEALLLNHLIRC